MERFAIINDKIRLNLYNICRLCGIDNPVKIKILDSLKIPNDNDEEPCLSKKIECVVGIKVRRNDQMPQSICTLCADKINDFFEYREMCSATNIQTRKLLGIPLDVAKRKRPYDKEIKAEGESILGLGIEDEDITDSKSSVKLAKQRVKGRPKKKGNSSSSNSSISSSKKKVFFKDEDVKVESEETKIETHHKNMGKRLKIDLKKIADPTPLLTLKEPNKRERRREIDAQKLERRRIREEQRREIEEKKREIELAKQILEQKKLEKKRKKKNSDPEPPVKKLKQEPDVSVTSPHFCSICSETFSNSDHLTAHLQQSHTVTISTYGCSSCAESFKTLDEEKDHEIWHSLSKTSYICPICNVAFDKTSIFTRHITLCKPFNLTPTVTNIRCDKCSQEFLTQNLYQWHKCFVKANGACWHCNRIFVKASTLFKHTFKCTSTHSSGSSHKDHAPIGSDAKKNRKNRTIDSHIKSEPEANLDTDIPSSTTSHLLTPDMLPVVVLTKTIFKPNHTFAINPHDMSIKTENDLDVDDNSHLDEAFGDANDTDNEDTDQVNGVASTVNRMMETFSDDDDVILIENNDEPVVVNGSPSGAQNSAVRPFVLPIVIKREPVDSYEVSAQPIFDPAKKIKLEPLDETADVCNDTRKQLSPKRTNSKSRKSKKSTHKSYKDRLVHIKEEPVDPDDVFRSASRHNLGSAIVSLPTTNLLQTTTIKQEPIRPGYDDDFDPILAMNIKKEPGLEESSPSRLPSLRLLISKKHGTLNAKLISAQGHDTDSEVTTSKPAKSKRAKDKCLYKKPALLAEKIRQEMIARQAAEKGSASKATHRQSADETNDFTVPVIARVLDATTISDLPLVRVKMEPKSPARSPSNQDLDTIPLASDEQRTAASPTHSFNFDQLNDDAKASSSNDFSNLNSSVGVTAFNSIDDNQVPATSLGIVRMEESTAVATDSRELKSFDVDIDSVCGISSRSDGNDSQGRIDETTSTGCEKGQSNEDLMALAGMTLSELMKQTGNDESNGHTLLESNNFNSDRVSNELISMNQQSNFDSTDRDTFKLPDEHKVVSYEEINEIISTLPLSDEQNVIKGDVSLNSNDDKSNAVMNDISNPADLHSSKENADGKNSVLSDSSESNKLNYGNVNTHSSSESHSENSNVCNEALVNDNSKTTDTFLANGGDDAVENELLKSPVPDHTDYELNSVQTLTTSAIHEQLNSLLEDISEDSLSCDIDLDDKTVDWEWESKLLGD